jgi:hypothetical protein
VIIASDVVYGDNESIWDMLILSIENIAKIGRERHTPNSNNNRTLLLMAQTARYPTSEKKFYKKLKEKGFSLIFHRCISRDAINNLSCSSDAESCNDWEWQFDYDGCEDESITYRHQLYAFNFP